jgi:ribosome-binding protein aMBF1 (putative translation factor)
MTPDRFRDCLQTLRWRPFTLAAALSCDERMVRNWASGRMTIPERVAKWLEALARHAERHPAPDDWRVHRGYSAA